LAGIPSEQGINRELRSTTDKKVTRAQFNETYLEGSYRGLGVRRWR
jgi:hypothetical protein